MSAIGAIGLTLRTLFGKDDEYDVDDYSEENFLTMLKTAVKDKVLTIKDAAILTQASREVDHNGENMSYMQIKSTSSGSGSGGTTPKAKESKEIKPIIKEATEKNHDVERDMD